MLSLKTCPRRSAGIPGNLKDDVDVEVWDGNKALSSEETFLSEDKAELLHRPIVVERDEDQDRMQLAEVTGDSMACLLD